MIWASRFAQKKQPHGVPSALVVGCFFCCLRRAIRSITFALVSLRATVVPLLSLSHFHEYFIFHNRRLFFEVCFFLDFSPQMTQILKDFNQCL
jgi:hypothetical protein